MIQIQLSDDHPMPALGLGTWDLRGEDCISTVQEALQLGYRHIDTAEMYGNESEIGRALKRSGISRKELFITTKVWTNHHRDSDFKKAIQESLERLRLSQVDLLLIHWPNSDVPLAETIGALCQVAQEGKCLSIGVSNFSPELLKKAIGLSSRPIVCDQIPYSLTENKKSFLVYARSQGICVCAYTPLGKGIFLKRLELLEVARKYGKTPAQVALRWLIQQKGVAAIPKASDLKHLKENIGIFDFSLDAEDHERLAKLQPPRGSF